MVHRQFGFFMNWAGTQKGEGFEFHLLALAITVFFMIRGAGAASVDRLLFPSAGDGTKTRFRKDRRYRLLLRRLDRQYAGSTPWSRLGGSGAVLWRPSCPRGYPEN
jgi:hypothetical protein